MNDMAHQPHTIDRDADVDLDAALNEILDQDTDETRLAPRPALAAAPPATQSDCDQDDQQDWSALPATAAGEPYIAALPVGELFADPTYQRELDEHRVAKMAKEFRIALVGIVEVSERPDSRYAILDGQHRWATVRDVTFHQPGTTHIACRVHTGLTVEREARLYHELNTTRRQLTGWDRWLARRGAGDPQVAAIETSLAGHGLTVAMRGGGNVFRSTKAAENVVDLGGINLLDQVIATIRAAWPDDQAGLDGNIVHGLGHVLDNYRFDELELARLITALAGILPRQLTARASAARELHKGTLDRLVGHTIVDRYNATKGDRLEPFFSRVKPVSKTKTAKQKAEVEHRAAVLAWARETSWGGTTYHVNASPKMRAAYDAAHPTQEES